jgi:hypothetical protein
MTPTELKMQPTIHLYCKPRSISSFALQMYCGLYFQFGLIITREIPCIAQIGKNKKNNTFSKISRLIVLVLFSSVTRRALYSF